ncbi:MAG TPA: sigma-54 dependent transcriptional regulator [Dissulfurispiraceae bacterium]|nr:sigma-54 dependent transcriptional regulator [Dissulfurispiraceae bacterium]
MKAKILILDDEPDICKALRFLLEREDYSVTCAYSGEEGLAAFQKDSFDVVLSDLKMGRIDGMAVLEKIKEINPEMPVVIMTAFGSIESAVDAMKQGAADYIIKPFLNEEIKLTIGRIIEQKKIIRRIMRENIALKQQISQRMACREFVANSDAMIRIIETLEKVIPTKSNILILGDSGTGKGLLAELVHCNSPRRDKPFICINCSAIPEGLLESELFGYRKGAFTGAVSDKVGLIALAHQGTLFLDEIGDMPINLQAKLLKVLETSEVYPLGDTKPRQVDIRVIAATNVDIESRIKQGSFREDLYWRLNVIEIKIPPLRERKEDIEMLADHFVKKMAAEHNKDIKGLDRAALDLLLDHSWPGNIRELKNVIERSVVLAEGPFLKVGDLPEKFHKDVTGKDVPRLKAYLSEYEKNLLLQVYHSHNRNKEETAKGLGIDLATLYRKFKKYGIDSE